MLGQQCWDVLCWNVAIVWPGRWPVPGSRFVGMIAKSGQATTSGIRERKAEDGPPVISPRPRSSTASDGLASHPGGSRNTPSRFMLQKQDKLRPDWPLAWRRIHVLFLEDREVTVTCVSDRSIRHAFRLWKLKRLPITGRTFYPR